MKDCKLITTISFKANSIEEAQLLVRDMIINTKGKVEPILSKFDIIGKGKTKLIVQDE